MAAVGPSSGRWIGLLLAAALAAVPGCGPKTTTRVSPTASSAPAPRALRIGVVDLQAVARVHPRWPDLDALTRRVAQTEAELAMVPPPPPVPETDVTRQLDEEAARLRAVFQKELEELRAQRRRELEAYAQDLRRAQEAKFEAFRRQLEDQARAELEAKRNELRAQLAAAEEEIMEEYRYPLLNLRLRAEVAGLRSEEEGRVLLRQLQALQQEREERIRVRGEETEAQFKEIQKAKEAEVNARLRAEQEALSAEGRRLVELRQRELEEALTREGVRREQEFRQRLERRRRELIAAAAAALSGQQRAYAREVQARAARLQAQLGLLQEQRLRLEDAILADVKIEVATIAQTRQVDVVLTRYIASPGLGGAGLVNLTPDLIRKIRR
ncbi:MAG: hypothetical protein QN141_03255 [Armatimonadota bacterium]|nr:hypothetical protein [Armatimonadota bacterium]MDR7451361.1 hypothetical protein [Armatimonadota bacterium]MDR7466489.1 hypothetical protein [Armatimonadota bacterium]MDR7493211.1 hypothetical protein [Armatimonadota bacterium]MDR7499436.1 hypothetical protein [Armatimonadota bacterium]